ARPYLRNVGHTGAVKLLLEHRRAHDGAIARHLVRAATDWWHAENDRIIAMINGFDLQHRLGALVRSIITGPFPERSFEFAVIIIQKSLENDLGVGGKRQAGNFSTHAFHRLPAHAADDVVFAQAVRLFGSSHEEKQ